MPRLTRIYTRKGDDGTTGLGGGQRVAKDSLRVATYGTVDELNSAIGVALATGLVPVAALVYVALFLVPLANELASTRPLVRSPWRSWKRRTASSVVLSKL